ncbi:MAG TPA: hypothetical protein VFS90_19390, partial [Pyrinomonadaceae bacterium]|nr:hypothetical protein [Pyrinomonadaceae bacterium]
VPTLATFETYARIVVAAIARDNCYFMSACSETSGEIGEVLCRGDHIRVEALVEEKNFQKSMLTRRRNGATILVRSLRRCATA